MQKNKTKPCPTRKNPAFTLMNIWAFLMRQTVIWRWNKSSSKLETLLASLLCKQYCADSSLQHSVTQSFDQAVVVFHLPICQLVVGTHIVLILLIPLSWRRRQHQSAIVCVSADQAQSSRVTAGGLGRLYLKADIYTQSALHFFLFGAFLRSEMFKNSLLLWKQFLYLLNAFPSWCKLLFMSAVLIGYGNQDVLYMLAELCSRLSYFHLLSSFFSCHSWPSSSTSPYP